jgi:decaprenyl-phosphate phosphoribosyltransferase
MSAVRDFIVEARPKQWLKNLLVFAGPGAAGVLNESEVFLDSVLVFIGFCVAASGTYFLNDVIDRNLDHNHPVKRTRPIASGRISVRVGTVVSVVLLIGGIVIASTPRWQAGGIVLLYVVLTVSYSVYLKKVPLLELAVIASGFVLRAMAGAAGTEIPMSTWFLLSITFGSFFVASGKRFAEVMEFGSDSRTRTALSEYSVSYLRQLIVFSCTATAISYFLWAFENASDSASDFPFHELSIVPMVLSLLRYVMVLESGQGEAPEDIFLKDRAIQMYVLSWLTLYVVGVYTT